MAELNVLNIPATPGNYNLTGKKIMVHDPAALVGQETKLADAGGLWRYVRGLQTIDAREFGVSADNTDNAAAITSALMAALAIGGRVQLPPGVLRFSNIELPYNSPDNGNILDLVEIVGASHPVQFFGTVGAYPMPTKGTILQCEATTGAAFWVNAPAGSSSGGISLIQLIVRNLTIRVVNPDVHGLLAGKCSQLIAENLQIDTGVYSAACLEPTGSSTGLETPIVNNGALTLLRNISVSGFFYGIVGNEHTDATGINLTSNKVGLLIQPGYHSQYYHRVCAQRNQVGIGVDLDNVSEALMLPYFTIQQLDVEHPGSGQTDADTAWQNPVWDLVDPASNGRGEVTWNITKGGVGQAGITEWLQNGATNMRVRQMGTAW